MAFSIESLNEVQKQAVTYGGEKHCLILAGAGSGKTRVLTHRIAWLVSQGVPSWAILAITFTNKAAREMRERANALLPENEHNVLLSTFHSFGARLLRQYAEFVGLQKSFSIYSESEQKTLVKAIMMQHGMLQKSEIETSETEIKQDKAAINECLNTIMGWKEKGLSVKEAKEESNTRQLESIALVYEEYEKQLLANNAVDFAGLLLWPLYLLNYHDDIRERIHNKYQHILVDEFQDTNSVQLQLLEILCGPKTKLTVVGDDDQSIYTWRGADPKAILEFEKRYGKCEVFKLEQNYRSTHPILTCAGNLIACNKVRTEKRLWTDLKGGEKVHCINYPNDWEEASGVIASIRKIRNQKQLSWRDFAVLYRKNSQSVYFERECTKFGMPYQVVGSVGFFEREEIVDLMSYLRILVNPSDKVALRRIMNKPVRGIGDKTCDKIIELLDKRSLFGKEEPGNRLMNLLDDIIHERCKIPRAGAKVIAGCQMFYNLLSQLCDWRSCTPRETLEKVIKLTKYGDFLIKSTAKKGQETEEAEERIAALLQMMDLYQKENPNDLAGFIEEMTLVRPDEDDSKAAINLMTIHSAKGLEFDVVYIIGIEEGILPLERGGICDVEEERRLMYVAMTRAKRVLYLTHAQDRHEYGRTIVQEPSRFFDEMKSPGTELLMDTITIESRNTDFNYGRPQLAWSRNLSKTISNKPVKQYDIMDEVGEGRPKPSKKYSPQSEDFIADTRYEEDAIDIHDDIFLSPSENPVVNHIIKTDVSATSAKDKNGKKLLPGDHVSHNVYGVGTIVKIEKTGAECKAIVNFMPRGMHTIITRFLVRL